MRRSHLEPTLAATRNLSCPHLHQPRPAQFPQAPAVQLLQARHRSPRTGSLRRSARFAPRVATLEEVARTLPARPCAQCSRSGSTTAVLAGVPSRPNAGGTGTASWPCAGAAGTGVVVASVWVRAARAGERACIHVYLSTHWPTNAEGDCVGDRCAAPTG